MKSRRGHLRLSDLQQSARKRLMLAAVAAFAMVVSGFLLVALLKPPDEGASNAMGASPSTDNPNPEAVAKAVEPEKAPVDKAVEPAVDKAPEPEAPAVAVEDKDTGDDKGEPVVEGDDAEVVEKGEDPPAEDDPAEPEADPLADDGEEDGWWKDIHGKTCVIEFGDHKRLIMREGRLAKDQTTTYGPFVNGAIKARVRESLNPTVTVHHLGLHPRNQRPSLAYVTLHQNGMDISGILPLQISGDQLKLVPSKGRRK